MNGDGDEDGAGTGVEASERTQDGSGDGSGDGVGTGTGVQIRGRTQDGNGDGSGDGNESSSGDGNGDEDGIGEGGGEGEKRNNHNKTWGRDVGNGGDLGGKRKTRRQERVGSVAADLLIDNLEDIKRVTRKEGGREVQGIDSQDSSNNCTSRESVSPLSRLIRGFRNKYHCSPRGRINASGK